MNKSKLKFILMSAILMLIAACQETTTQRSSGGGGSQVGPQATNNSGTNNPNNSGYNPSPSPSPSASPTPDVYPGPTFSPFPIQPTCLLADADICQIEAEITACTNEFRQTRGMGTLIQDFEVSASARKYSERMPSFGMYLRHENFPSGRERDYYSIWNKQFEHSTIGENIAFQSGRTMISDRLCQMWIKSDGHRANMLGNWKYIGVGVIQQNGYYYATQLFWNK